MSGAAAAADLSRRAAAFLSDTSPRRLGVAVSGGGDSMALLDLMAGACAAAGVALEAVTLDHGLRPEAAAEADFVARHCAGRGIPHETLHWHWDGRGNLSAAARAARYALIATWAARRGVDLVALGHTRDDQAENLLIRLSRAAGTDGLAAMERRFTRHGVTFARPLLDVPRQALRDHLAARGIRWHEDPGNDDPAYERSRARQALARLEPLGLGAGALARVAGQQAQVRDALAHYTAAEARRLARIEAGDLLLADDPDLPAEIRRRLHLAALQWIAPAPYPPRNAALEAMQAALADSGTATLAGCLVTREPGRLRFTREPRAVAGTACATTGTWDDRWRLAGPHAPELQVRALGEGVSATPWRATGLPRRSLQSSPAIWQGEALVAAPLAGLPEGWTAVLADCRRVFAGSPL